MHYKSGALALIPIGALVAVAVLISRGQTQAEDIVEVSLEDRTTISPVQEISGCTFSHHKGPPLRVAIAGVTAPLTTLDHYQDLLAYMSEALEHETTFILRPTYAEINDLIRGQHVDVGFVCTLAYVIGKEEFGMELLVAPVINGETSYYSYLIVPANSQAGSLADLRDRSFAFVDPMSNSGHLAPTYQLSLLGETPVSFFSRYIFTYSHDNSITAVASKLVDAAAVDSLIYDQLRVSDPELIARTRVIARWGPYGIPPIVVHPGLAPGLKEQLRGFFLGLNGSEEGRRILDSLRIDRFAVVEDSIYDSIREMKTRLGW